MAEPSGTQTTDKKQPAASGAEVIFLLLLVVFGIGLCGVVERNFNWFWPEPTEKRAFGAPRITEKQEQLDRLEIKIKETEKQIDAAEFEQLKQQASQANTQEATKAFVSLLNARLTSQKADAERIGQELKLEKQMATDKLRGERRRFLLLRFAASILLPLIVVLLTFLVGAALLSWVTGELVWAIRKVHAVQFVAGVLLILLVYKVLDIAGAALIGIVAFFFVLRKIDWTKKVLKKEAE